MACPSTRTRRRKSSRRSDGGSARRRFASLHAAMLAFMAAGASVYGDSLHLFMAAMLAAMAASLHPFFATMVASVVSQNADCSAGNAGVPYGFWWQSCHFW
eukprot:3485212-Rhodomonas_salina.1